jgi:hypothetical protein
LIRLLLLEVLTVMPTTLQAQLPLLLLLWVVMPVTYLQAQAWLTGKIAHPTSLAAATQAAA